MPKYKHIFFDLDHTLWDYEKNSAETLNELYSSFNLSALELFSVDDFVRVYNRVNKEMWVLYGDGMITKQQLRVMRFDKSLKELGAGLLHIPRGLDEAYVKGCPDKTHVIPHAHEVLDYLVDKYELHIITNGFEEQQARKMTNSGLSKYFKKVINSENAKFKKPQREIFDYAINSVSCTPDTCIMIGDNLLTDIQGAQNADLDHVYYNPDALEHTFTVTHEILCLRELKGIL